MTSTTCAIRPNWGETIGVWRLRCFPIRSLIVPLRSRIGAKHVTWTKPLKIALHGKDLDRFNTTVDSKAQYHPGICSIAEASPHSGSTTGVASGSSGVCLAKSGSRQPWSAGPLFVGTERPPSKSDDLHGKIQRFAGSRHSPNRKSIDSTFLLVHRLGEGASRGLFRTNLASLLAPTGLLRRNGTPTMLIIEASQGERTKTGSRRSQ